MARTSVRIDIDLGDPGAFVTAYKCEEDGQWSMLASEAFGPFDTAFDILQWALRKTVPVLGLPLR